MFFSNILPYRSFGHFTLEFDFSLIPALKPKVSSFVISNLINFENVSPDPYYGFFDAVTSSQLLPLMLVCYMFVGAFPAYVRDAVQRFGKIWMLFALLVTSYVVFFFINSLYYNVPGFDLTASNVASLMLSVILAWMIYIILQEPAPRLRREGEEPIILPGEKEGQEVIVSEGTRVDALRRELEEGEED